MRLQLLCFLSIVYNFCHGQVVVEKQEPFVSFGDNKVLYMGYENTVFISAGNLQKMEVTIVNGTITMTNIVGKYIVVPGDNSTGITTVVLKAKNFEKRFDYRVTSLPLPQIDFLTKHRTVDDVPGIRASTGIYLYYPTTYDIEPQYTIDSFKVDVTDTTGKVLHYTNVGSLWNEELRQQISNSPLYTRVFVYDLYISDKTGKSRRSGYISLEGYTMKWEY